MADFLFKPAPHTEAIKILADKPVVTRDVFNRLLPELQARAFTMTGIEDAATLQRLKDVLQNLPEGRPWDDVKNDVLADVSPWLVPDGLDPEERAKAESVAERRAELLMRHNGYQAYMAAKHEVMTRQADVMPFWQYISMEDGRVRDSHAALNGMVLPADSPFWSDHTPPWDWGCRCELVPLQPWEVDDIKEAQSVEDRGSEGSMGWTPGPAEQRSIEKDGRVSLGPNMPVDVTAPRKKTGNQKGSFGWNPADMRIGLDELRERYDKDVFATFETFAKNTKLEDGRSLWDWLDKKGAA